MVDGRNIYINKRLSLQMHKIHLGTAFAKTCKFIMNYIPKNKKLILFSSWRGMKYSDNSMYEFEYFLKNSTYTVYWYTKNKLLLSRV